MLEREVEGVKNTLDNQILPLLQKIDRGLYGEKENDAEGLIRNQIKLEEAVEILQKEVIKLQKKNDEQDLIINAEGNVKDKWISIGKIFLWAIVNIIVIVGIAKGLVSIDALK